MKQKVLVVDDEAILVLNTAKVLEKNGYAVATAKSADEIYSLLESEDTLPDLILMDIDLGRNRLDGTIAAEKIYRQYNIPIVFHSGHTDEETLAKTEQITKYGYVQKAPGNEQFLLATVRMAFKLKHAERELTESETRYRELSGHLQSLREEQNAYIAREIHDDLGQALTALKMNLSFIRQDVEDKPEVITTIEEMRTILDMTVKKVRELSKELRPDVLDTSTIGEALEWQAGEFEKYSGIPVIFHTSKRDFGLSQEQSLAVFRIVQEALTNCARHAQASKVYLTVETKNNNLTIDIRDNGAGFQVFNDTYIQSFGIMSMQERAFSCNGTLTIDSKVGGGTKVSLRIPLESDS
jgi:signal transduction histidine kinase